tara:strand:+ start:13492 stop:13761 length:270 start_codon:yes stop_codon:yes gene_type:complete
MNNYNVTDIKIICIQKKLNLITKTKDNFQSYEFILEVYDLNYNILFKTFQYGISKYIVENRACANCIKYFRENTENINYLNESLHNLQL